MSCTDEELVLLATTIAMELAKGKSQEEIEDLRNLVNQISCSLTSLLHCRCSPHRHLENLKK